MEKQYRLKKKMDDAPTVHVVRGEEDAQDDSASDRAGKAKTGRQETPKSGNNKLGGGKRKRKREKKDNRDINEHP